MEISHEASIPREIFKEVRELLTALTEHDEKLIRRLIKKISVYEDKFTVEFKSGVTVDVEG